MQAAPNKYMLTKITDPHNNILTISYATESKLIGIAGCPQLDASQRTHMRAIYPLQMVYDGGQVVVDFIQAARTDCNIPNYGCIVYAWDGDKQNLWGAKRLSAINVTVGGVLARRYELNHSTTTTGAKRMKLDSIVIADDHAPFRAGVRAMLQTVPDIEVVGEAATGEEVIALAASLQPDVILMDLQMPAVNGIEATRRIVLTSPHIGVLVLTMFEDDDSVFAALRAGARGYLLKGALKVEILRAIRGVSSGEAIFGSAIAKRLMQYFASPRSNAPPQTFPELTEREREILTLIAHHLTNPEIAERLSLSLKTVRNHVSNIFNKLHVTDRAQAIIRVRSRAGI